VVGRAVSLFAHFAALRTAGARASGFALVRALGSADETLRTLAGVLLVKAGNRAVPVLRETIARREHLLRALAILGDIATPEAERELAPFAADADPGVAATARDALDTLQRNRALGAVQG
jgi:HEAT repeat protein